LLQVIISRCVQGENMLMFLHKALLHPTEDKVRDALSAVVQTVAILQALHALVGAVHNDAHLGNWLVEEDLSAPLVWPGGAGVQSLTLPPGPRVFLIDYGDCTYGTGAAVGPGQQSPVQHTSGQDMATVAAMLVFAIPVLRAHTWTEAVAEPLAEPLAVAAPAFASVPWSLVLQNAVAALDDLIRATLTCGSAPPSSQAGLASVVRCHTLITQDPTTRCAVDTMQQIRDRSSGCSGVEPKVWLRDRRFVGPFAVP
jgi:hypothetical protein